MKDRAQTAAVPRIAAEEREVSLLFADLRESTALTAALEPDQAYELISQVVECLTAAVVEHDGVIIDYYGDGLAAMWNAPAEQPDHAELSCSAALRMLQTLPDISHSWPDFPHRDLRIGIGIHTGSVHVGNSGSRRHAKYGPRGTNVNLASRIEAATKRIGLPLVVTGATAEQLTNRFVAHRICRARMPGLARQMDLFAISRDGDAPAQQAAWELYDRALKCFESGDLQAATDSLIAIDATATTVPYRFLLKQIERERSKHRRRSADHLNASARGTITLS